MGRQTPATARTRAPSELHGHLASKHVLDLRFQVESLEERFDRLEERCGRIDRRLDSAIQVTTAIQGELASLASMIVESRPGMASVEHMMTESQTAEGNSERRSNGPSDQSVLSYYCTNFPPSVRLIMRCRRLPHLSSQPPDSISPSDTIGK
jgi:hypothetical protein